MRRLADLECYLLSGVDANGTVAAEFAAVFGASDDLKQSEFPKGGAEAITVSIPNHHVPPLRLPILVPEGTVISSDCYHECLRYTNPSYTWSDRLTLSFISCQDALARAVLKNGGEIRLKTHVDKIVVDNGVARGVLLRNGVILSAPVVMSNASVWDTYGQLLPPGSVSKKEKEDALGIPCSESFMHLHLGIDATGLDFAETGGHHVVVRDDTKPIDKPGNVCMISIASVWEPDMAPKGHHCIHAYTMEPFEGWER